MIKLPWQFKLERRPPPPPPPLPQEVQDLVLMMDQLADQVRDMAKQVNRIERKVYRDLEDQDVQLGTTVPSEADIPRGIAQSWNTGDPA